MTAPDRPLRVVYIDGVGPFGGASRSLFEVVRALPPGTVDPHFVIQRGTVLGVYGQVARGIVTTRGLTRFDNTRASYYRGIRWLIVLRELFHFPFTLVALLRARRLWGEVDIVHVNEVTEIVPGILASRLLRAPLLVHVRSLQRGDASSWRSRWLNRKLRSAATAVIAIDENVRATLPPELDVDVIHNSFTAQHAPQRDQAFMLRLDALQPRSFKVGFVGNLHYSKGLFDLLEAARLIRAAGREVEFLIVGGATAQERGLKAWALGRAGLKQDVRARLLELREQYGLTDTFHLLGATTDIQCAYERMDVICFPSHFDAPGRPVFEAAFSGVPAIVAVTNPRPDTLIDGETGLAIPARDPEKLAAAILYFADRPQERLRMGENARRLAQANFVPERNAQKLLALYRRLAAVPSGATGRADTSGTQASIGAHE